eukprot:TRINITY_DN13289_c0_g1_i2.p1 TRINITY_DN13289_c0_g1~~TRINITY_DN13289_c0_g1_i2.p1  ORF type:complete len:432 (-),score=74.29 TRINITY_DN13289_c0_g1_i2:95-1390(-)
MCIRDRSSFGRVFRVTTFGESHSKGVGCIVEGVPSRMNISQEDIQKELDRRRPGQSVITTARKEADQVIILSGLENGISLGTPISLLVMNEDARPSDYSKFSDIPRPGHADYTYLMKYQIKAESGGGRSSARETIGRVAAGAIARKMLFERCGLEIISWVSRVGEVSIPYETQQQLVSNPPSYEYISKKSSLQFVNDQGTLIFRNVKEDTYFDSRGESLEATEERRALFNDAKVENIALNCPDTATAVRMAALILAVKADKDSVGGVITCACKNVPPGLGEPCFDKLEALLAHAMLSIPATKGFEIGSGFEGTKMRGSQHNDIFISAPPEEQKEDGNVQKLRTKSNNAGGILGGISSGENIYFNVAFKPVSTIGIAQATADFKGNERTLTAAGRHDPCVLPRAPPIVESMAALVLADLYLLQYSSANSVKI